MKDYLVIVIDSSSVQALYKGKMLAHKYMPMRDKTSIAHVEHMMLNTLTTVLQGILKQTGSVDKIHVILSSPWIVSKTKTSHFNYPKAVVIDRSYLEDVIEDERTAFKKIFPFDIEFVEQKVFETKVNGYSARIKKSVPAMSLEISSAMSAMSKTIVKKIVDCVEHFYHGTKISFHSSLILSYLSMRHSQPEIENGVFVYVHGECSDLTVFKNGVPHHFASINYGTHTLVRDIAHHMQTSEGVAESKITLFEDGALHTQAEDKVTPAIEAKLSMWSSHIVDSLTQLESSPSTIVVYSPIFATLFSNTLANTFDANIVTLADDAQKLYTQGIELVEFHQ